MSRTALLVHAWQRRARWALPVLLLVFGVLALPIALPVLPPAQVAAYFEAIGEEPQIEAADVGHAIPLHLLGRLEWDRLAEEVIAAFEALPAESRERAVILAPHWVLASVVEYHGRDRGLAPVVSPHNAYFFWREEALGRDAVVSVGIPAEALEGSFAETRLLGWFRCRQCASWRQDMPILLSSGPVRPLDVLLGEWRTFGSPASEMLTQRGEAG